MSEIGRLLAPLARRIGNLLARGTVTMANSANRMQTLQLKLLSGETKDGIEHFEPYGYTSNPKHGAEHLTGFLDGDRSHGITVVVADRRYRLRGLAEGEVALYDDLGHKVHLTRNGIVIDGAAQQITLTNASKVRIECSLEVTGDIKDNCDGATGKTMSAMRTTYNGHTHVETGSTTNSPTQQM